MHLRTAAGAAFIAAFCVLSAPSIRGQSNVPRTPWGDPDLQGRWTNATLTPLERPKELGGKEFFTAAEAAEYEKIALKTFLASTNLTAEAALSGEFNDTLWMDARSIVASRRTSLIVGPTGRVPALTAGAQRAADARGPRRLDFADNPEDLPAPERCLWFQVGGPPMLPSVVYNSNYQIVQTPTHVVVLAEMGYSVRIIRLGGGPHPPAHIRSWEGDSVGRWDGDTLVVETTNFNSGVIFRGSTRENLRLVERFRRVGPDEILYQFTADDPSTWTSAWSAEVPMRRFDPMLYEYACHEGNVALENILRGARYAERAR